MPDARSIHRSQPAFTVALRPHRRKGIGGYHQILVFGIQLLRSAGRWRGKGTPSPCGGELSKACQLLRRGTEQPLICSAQDVRALQWHDTQRSLQSPCTHSHPHKVPRLGTINTKGLGCYSDMRSIPPLEGPQSPHFPLNQLPNNEPQFTPSPLLSPPVILPHRTIRYP